MSQTTSKLPDTQETKLSGNMGTFALVMTVLAFSAPLSTATGFIPQLLIYGDIPGGGNSAPWIYVMCIITLGCFAVGFAKMGTVMERPGGFYAYIVDALGKKIGLGAAFTSAIGYSCVGFFMPGLMAIVCDGLLTSVGGPSIPWPVWALFFALLSTLLASMSIDFSAKFLFITMVCEVAIMLIFDVVTFVHGSPAGTTGGSWSMISLSTGTVGIAMLFAMGNFYGFEATVIYREEVKEPRKTIPRATFIAVFGIGIFYLLCAWGFMIYFGSENVAAAAEADSANMFVNVLNNLIAPAFAHIVSVVSLVSMFASGLAIHNVGARYFYSLGVDGALPKLFGKVHPKQKSPYVAALTIGAFWVVLIIIFAALGYDAEYTYTRPNVVGNLFVTAMIGLVAVAVFVYLRKNNKINKFGVVSTTICPIIGLIGILLVIVMCVTNLNAFLGTETVGSIIIVCLLFAVIIFGAVYAGWLEKHKPEVYARIGRYDPDTQGLDEVGK